MKNLFCLVIVFCSLSVFAEDRINCSNDVHEIAMMNLNQKAKKYGHDSADITLKPKLIKEKGDKQDYEVYGHIYKANYTVSVSVDLECSVVSVKIKEVLLKN